MDQWDGVTERRKVSWHDIESKLVRLEMQWMNQFGGEGVEGNIPQKLGEIRDLLRVQNGRVKSLEEWRAGVLAAATLVVLAIGWAINIFK